MTKKTKQCYKKRRLHTMSIKRVNLNCDLHLCPSTVDTWPFVTGPAGGTTWVDIKVKAYNRQNQNGRH